MLELHLKVGSYVVYNHHCLIFWFITPGDCVRLHVFGLFVLPALVCSMSLGIRLRGVVLLRLRCIHTDDS